MQRWDWAGAISWVVVQRSDPSIIDEIYGEAVEDFYLDVEAKIYAEALGGGTGHGDLARLGDRGVLRRDRQLAGARADPHGAGRLG